MESVDLEEIFCKIVFINSPEVPKSRSLGYRENNYTELNKHGTRPGRIGKEVEVIFSVECRYRILLINK